MPCPVPEPLTNPRDHALEAMRANRRPGVRFWGQGAGQQGRVDYARHRPAIWFLCDLPWLVKGIYMQEALVSRTEHRPRNTMATLEATERVSHVTKGEGMKVASRQCHFSHSRSYVFGQQPSILPSDKHKRTCHRMYAPDPPPALLPNQNPRRASQEGLREENQKDA